MSTILKIYKIYTQHLQWSECLECSFNGTTAIGTELWCTILSETLPLINRLIAPLPWLPRITRSGWGSRCFSIWTRLSGASPNIACNLTVVLPWSYLVIRSLVKELARSMTCDVYMSRSVWMFCQIWAVLMTRTESYLLQRHFVTELMAMCVKHTIMHIQSPNKHNTITAPNNISHTPFKRVVRGLTVVPANSVCFGCVVLVSGWSWRVEWMSCDDGSLNSWVGVDGVDADRWHGNHSDEWLVVSLNCIDDNGRVWMSS